MRDSCATPKRALSNRGSSQIFGEVRSATDSPGQQPARLSVLRGSLDRRRLQSRARSWRLRGCADASALFRFFCLLFHTLRRSVVRNGRIPRRGEISSRDNRARERERESEGYHLATQQQLIATSVVVVNETSTRSSEMKLVEETKPESFRRLARRELDGESWVELGGN